MCRSLKCGVPRQCGVVDRGELDAVARHVAHELPGAAADRLLAELLLADLLDIGLGHDGALGRHRARQRRPAGRSAGWWCCTFTVRSSITSMLLMVRRMRRRGRGERARAHLALEAELHVVRGELVAVVECLAGPEMEGPGQAVVRRAPSVRRRRGRRRPFRGRSRPANRTSPPGRPRCPAALRGSDRASGRPAIRRRRPACPSGPGRKSGAVAATITATARATALPMCRSISSSLNVEL